MMRLAVGRRHEGARIGHGYGATHGHESEHTAGYGAAFSVSIDVLRARARQYRNLVVAVALVAIGAALACLISWSPVPLLACLAILPLCGWYIASDIRQLACWQLQILKLWVTGDLNLLIFSRAIRARQDLPRGTLEGMLALLPVQHGACEHANQGGASRQWILDVARLLCADRRARAVAVVVDLVIVVGAAFVAVLASLVIAAAVLLLIPVAHAISKLIQKGRLIEWRRQSPRLSEFTTDLDASLENLGLGQVSRATRMAVLASMCAGAQDLTSDLSVDARTKS